MALDWPWLVPLGVVLSASPDLRNRLPPLPTGHDQDQDPVRAGLRQSWRLQGGLPGTPKCRYRVRVPPPEPEAGRSPVRHLRALNGRLTHLDCPTPPPDVPRSSPTAALFFVSYNGVRRELHDEKAGLMRAFAGNTLAAAVGEVS